MSYLYRNVPPRAERTTDCSHPSSKSMRLSRDGIVRLDGRVSVLGGCIGWVGVWGGWVYGVGEWMG